MPPAEITDRSRAPDISGGAAQLETNNLKDMEEELILVVDEDVDLESLQGLTSYPKMLLEHNIYQKFGSTKHYYRVDKANNAPGQQRHIHVFKDDEGQIQLFAINYDGTTHDGSKHLLSRKEKDALTSLGIPIPPNGLLEWEVISDGRMLLCD